MTVLHINSLTKVYDQGRSQQAVLAGVNLELHHGEVVALLGRSGSGKSTLLNLISGIDLPDKGIIEIDRHTLTAMSEVERTYWRRRSLGFVFQFFNLIPTLTAAENILLPLQLNNVNKTLQQQRVAELLAAVGLAGYDDNYPEQLSGGEQQRLAIARALVHRPDLLLADEPTGNLDNATSAQILELLFTIIRQHQTTALIVTHSDAVAEQADRIVCLEQGRLREQHG